MTGEGDAVKDGSVYVAVRAEDMDLAVYPHPYILKRCGKCGRDVCCTVRDYLADRWVNAKTLEITDAPAGGFTDVWCMPCLAAVLAEEGESHAPDR